MVDHGVAVSESAGFDHADGVGQGNGFEGFVAAEDIRADADHGIGFIPNRNCMMLS